jgi:hypothetical protein
MRRTMLIVGALLVLTGSLHAQRVTQIKLGPPTERLSILKAPLYLRELPDGRVLYTDGGIKLLDLRTGAVTTVGRQGGGPAEHRLPAVALFTLTWRDSYPPFDPTTWGRPVAGLDGRVLVSRYPTSKSPETTYDVVNRRGELEGRLMLPSNERIIGFGSKSIYVLEEDENGETWLRRHAWVQRAH